MQTRGRRPDNQAPAANDEPQAVEKFSPPTVRLGTELRSDKPFYQNVRIHRPAEDEGVVGRDGSITLPMNFTIRPKDPDDPKFKARIPYDQVGLAAAGTVSQVIVTAITAAPLKAAADVANLLGLGGGAKPPEDLTTRITFSPGSAAVGANQIRGLSPLLKKLQDDPLLVVTFRHTVGQGDVRLATVRANPTREECSGLESQLRSRKSELLKLRADAAGIARANLASMGSAAAEPSLEHLRSIDRELSATEESLDEVGELLKPGAERLAGRRTKTAALRIASERLKGIKAAMTAAGISPDRIKVVSAQYNPADGSDGGIVVITAVRKK